MNALLVCAETHGWELAAAFALGVAITGIIFVVAWPRAIKPLQMRRRWFRDRLADEHAQPENLGIG